MKVKSDDEYGMVYVSLGAAMLFGCYLRLHNITVDGLWLDEAFSVATSDPDNNFLDMYKQTLKDVHPAFYQFLLWSFYKVFGFGEMTGRYLSVIFGVLLIPSIFCLGKGLFSERVGLIAAWLAAVNFYLVTYSQETRSYALLALLTTISFVVFVIAIRKPNLLNVSVYALVIAMLVNTHYFGFLPVAAQVVLLLSFLFKTPLDRGVLFKFTVAGLFVLLTVMPGALYVWGNLKRQSFWVPQPNDRFFIELFVLYFGNLFLSMMFAVLLIVGLGCLMRDENKKQVLRVLVVWVAVCVVIPYARSIYFQSVLTMRNLIILLPALLVVLAFSIGRLTDRVTVWSVAIVVLCFSMTPLYTRYKPAFTSENQLRPVSQLRDLIKMMLESRPECLIYSPVSIEMQGYFKIFGSSVRVKGIDVMESDLTSAKRPGFFFIIATRGVWRPDADYMKKYNFRLVKENAIGDSSIGEYQSSSLDDTKSRSTEKNAAAGGIQATTTSPGSKLSARAICHIRE